jgi:HK97 family phage portal protein
MNFWQRMFGFKQSEARTVATMHQLGQAVSTPADYASYARQGFQKNAIVFRSIAMIAKAASGVKLLHYTGKKADPTELSESNLLTLLARPNPLQAGPAFIESVVAYYCLSGNSYIESNTGILPGASVPLELWSIMPSKMKVIGGPKGYPKAYRFSSNGQEKDFLVNVKDLRSEIMHWKTFHPLNDWYGMAPLEAAIMALDQSNSGQRWNLSLLQNMAQPSGVLQMQVSAGNPRGEMSKEQYARLRKEIDESYTGAKNAGRMMLLEGGLKWEALGFTPKEMDFLKSKEVTAIDIATVYGVPPELLGLGQKTFNNYREARGAFYEETVLPILDGLVAELNRWLVPAMGEEGAGEGWIGYDADDIEALTYKREAKFTMLATANYLTQNEKREAVGYETKEGWDVFLVGNQLLSTPDDMVDEAANGDGDEEGDNDESESGDEETDKPDATEDDETDDSENEDEDTEEDDAEKSFKSINLLTSNEKRRSWKIQNARRNQLQKSFDEDLREDFDALTSKLISATKDIKEVRLVEYAMLKTVNNFMPKLEKTIEHHVRRTVDSFGRMVLDEGKSFFHAETKTLQEVKANRKFEAWAKDYTSTRSGEAIKTITTTTQKNIRRVIGEWTQTAIEDGDTLPELSKFIRMEFGELTQSQSTRIARTEVGMASNHANREAIKSLGIPNMYKEWVSANDDRVRDGGDSGNDANHEAMNGEEVRLDEKFTVPPDRSMDGPGDDAGGADQVINCRCVLTFKSRN